MGAFRFPDFSRNEFKGSTTEAIDPVTSETVALYHPRQQIWLEHFMWSADRSKVEGLTAIGRSTVVALRMNNPVIQAARRRWAIVGWHPPAD